MGEAVRLFGSKLAAFKQQAAELHQHGMSYSAIGRLYGLSPWTVRYHLNEDAGALKREQMRFYNYMKATEDDYAGKSL